MIRPSECGPQLLERIAAGVGVDARVKLEEDAEGISAEFVGEDLGRSSATTAATKPTRSVRRMDSPARGAATAARRAITRVRADPDPPLPLGEDQECGITAPSTKTQNSHHPSGEPATLLLHPRSGRLDGH